jgi:hypothetical protein
MTLIFLPILGNTSSHHTTLKKKDMTGYFCIGVISEYVSRVYCRLLFFPCFDVYSIRKGEKPDI